MGNGKVGVTGFCMGGALALASAVKVNEISAVCCFYGVPDKALADPADLTVPLQVLHLPPRPPPPPPPHHPPPPPPLSTAPLSQRFSWCVSPLQAHFGELDVLTGEWYHQEHVFVVSPRARDIGCAAPRPPNRPCSQAFPIRLRPTILSRPPPRLGWTTSFLCTPELVRRDRAVAPHALRGHV